MRIVVIKASGRPYQILDSPQAVSLSIKLYAAMALRLSRSAAFNCCGDPIDLLRHTGSSVLVTFIKHVYWSGLSCPLRDLLTQVSLGVCGFFTAEPSKPKLLDRPSNLTNVHSYGTFLTV